MHKFIQIFVLVLVSATAQAGQTRGLILASNDTPNSAERIESLKPDDEKVDAKPEASKEVTKTSKPATETSKPKKAASKPVRNASRPARNYESDEARARSIAAKYGVSW
jgi:hypothetical protein